MPRSRLRQEKLMRLWVVKSGGNGCSASYPDLGSKCVTCSRGPRRTCRSLRFSSPLGAHHVQLGRQSQFDAILSTYVLGVVKALMVAIAPIALTAMTLWVALYGWAVLRNEVSETLPNFMWKVFKIGLVLAFALQSGFYISNVADTANALAMGVASTFLPSGVDPATVNTPYALLDKFNDDASAQVADIMKEASMFRLDLLLAAAIFSIGSVIFLCIALFVVTLSKLFLTFVIAVGPLFILCLAWRPTQRFFDSWLSMVLNAVVLTWFAFFALGLSAFMGVSMFKAIQDGGGFLGGNFNVLGEAMRYCVLMILMAIICFQAPASPRRSPAAPRSSKASR
jgi:type IV secretion system protein VirB6